MLKNKDQIAIAIRIIKRGKGISHLEDKNFHSVDPLADKFPWQTPYCAMDNDPINKIDPTGMAASPIYGTDGNFLGTDDQGIQGNAIVMNKADFSQGMKHEDALKKDLAPKGGDDFLKAIPNRRNYQTFYDHYTNLSTRPDYDGFVTRQEGISWAKLHPNALKNPSADNTLYINTALLEFGNIKTGDFAQTNEITPVNLLNFGNAASAVLDNKLHNTIYALGKVNMILTNRMDRTVSIVNDEATDYDWNTGGGYIRNKLIMDERKAQGLNDTHGFKTSYYGIGTLNWY